MDVSINVGYFGPHISDDKDLFKKLDDIGVSCVWTAEAYGYDAVTPLAYFSALTNNMNIGSGIMQIPARTPAMTAMTAVTLDQMSKGRFRLGLGVSGPQVVEGWHGVPYGKPLAKTREYVELVRNIIKREGKVEHNGEYYELPLSGENTTGLGKPLKLIDQPFRDEIPIYLAAVGLKNVEMTAEIADGWLPFMYSPLKGEEIYKDSLTNGFKKSGVSDKKDKFEIVTTVIGRVCEEEEVDEYLYPARNVYTLYVGGMGAKSKNFYYNLFCEYGYEDIADELQNLYLSGNKKESEKMFTIVLIEPQIPPNTGSTGRLCGATNTRLHVVGKLGFELSDRTLKRAGLDYWKHVDLQEHVDIEAFWLWAAGRDASCGGAGGRRSARLRRGQRLPPSASTVLPRAPALYDRSFTRPRRS